MNHSNAFSEQTDEWLARAALRDQEAFLMLMRRYEGKLMAYILRFSGFAREDAEDILQEVFLKTYINLNAFDDDLKFSSWIYRITHNEAINAYRKRKVRPHNAEGLDEDFLNNVPAEFKLDHEIDRRFLQTNMRRVLGKLKLEYREVLILRFWEDKDYREISDILKKPMGTVATLLNRAKKAFEEELNQDAKIL